MSNTCVIASCNSNTRRNAKSSAIKCFSFPKDPEIRNQWFRLCQIKNDLNRKVCIKHFKEEAFVDGLKARLMCLQPTKLKKDALPSLFLNSETLSEESRQMQIGNQEKICKQFKKQISTKDFKEEPNPKGSIEYLSKLVPIAPKGQAIKNGTIIGSKYTRIAPKEANTTPKKLKIAVEEPGFTLHRFKVLQHDNAIYKKKISTLLDNQNKLLARIKKLELEIKNEKDNYVNKTKKTFGKVLTSNQIDNILGRKKRRLWTDEEYSVALKLFNISKQAYEYVKDEMKYPLPGISNIWKWSSKCDLKSAQEKNKLSRDNKENGEYTIDDQIMLDDDHIMINDELIHDDQNIDNDDVKMEIKAEFVDESIAVIDHQNNENLDDLNDIMITIDHCDIDYEKIVSTEIKEENYDQDIESSDHNFKLDHGIAMNDENEEFYEELVIDKVYSDNDEIMIVYKKSNGEDNG